MNYIHEDKIITHITLKDKQSRIDHTFTICSIKHLGESQIEVGEKWIEENIFKFTIFNKTIKKMYDVICIYTLDHSIGEETVEVEEVA